MRRRTASAGGDFGQSLQLDRYRISELRSERFDERLAQRPVEEVFELVRLTRKLGGASGRERFGQERVPHAGRNYCVERLAHGLGQEVIVAIAGDHQGPGPQTERVRPQRLPLIEPIRPLPLHAIRKFPRFHVLGPRPQSGLCFGAPTPKRAGGASLEGPTSAFHPCCKVPRVRKIVVHRPGSYDRLVLEDHSDPEPAPGELLVQPVAIGVNYADCIVRMGLYASAKQYVGWPITPGFEFAGRVLAVRPARSGDGCEAFAPGDAVFGVTRFGAYASRIAVPCAQLFRVPSPLSLVQAAAFPTVFLTAWYALCELVRLRPKMTVLVHSAAGGVGGALLDIARASGCTPVAVVGASHKVEVARALGAHAVIDKSREQLWPAARRLVPEGYDVVLDANGPSTLKQSYEHLKPTGKLIVYGFHSMIPRRGGRPNWPKLALDYLRTPRFGPFALTTDNKSVLAFNLSYLFERMDLLREGMQGLLDWVMAGKLSALPVRELPLDRVGEAHRELESGMTVGKFVLIPVSFWAI